MYRTLPGVAVGVSTWLPGWVLCFKYSFSFFCHSDPIGQPVFSSFQLWYVGTERQAGRVSYPDSYAARSVKIRKQIRHYLASTPVPFCFWINNIWTRPKIKKLQKYVLQKISFSLIPVPLFSSPEAATVNGFLGVWIYTLLVSFWVGSTRHGMK